jgi:hypothetical protein
VGCVGWGILSHSLARRDELALGGPGSKGRGRCSYAARDSGSVAVTIARLSEVGDGFAEAEVVIEDERGMSSHSCNKRCNW